MKLLLWFPCLPQIILLVIFSFPSMGHSEKLKHCFTGSTEYLIKLLELALSYEENNYEIEETGKDCTLARQIEQVIGGSLSFIWAGTTKELESRLLPIRIPLFRGLLGHRIFIIREGEQYRFDSVSSIQDVKKFKLGQGRHWGDTAILESQGFTVAKSNKYQSLFPMLDGGRFDAFPRGVHEPWSEVQKHAELPLAIEKTIVIVYPMPAYFFVSKQNQALAELVENGLREAIKDRKFIDMFLSDPAIKKVLSAANLQNRKLYYIDNPHLPEETPLNEKALWLDIRTL